MHDLAPSSLTTPSHSHPRPSSFNPCRALLPPSLPAPAPPAASPHTPSGLPPAPRGRCHRALSACELGMACVVGRTYCGLQLAAA